MKNYKKGFTLIELLVVIAIISLLSSVILASLSKSRSKALISATNSTVLQYRNAIELYAVDHGNTYPTPATTLTACVGDYRTITGTYTKCGSGTNGAYPVNFYTNNLAMAVSNVNLGGGAVTGATPFRQYIKGFPMVSSRPFVYNGSNTWLGAIYKCDAAVNSQCTKAHIDWYIEGVGQNCISGATVDPDYNPTNYDTAGNKIANNPGLGLSTRCRIKFGS